MSKRWTVGLAIAAVLALAFGGGLLASAGGQLGSRYDVNANRTVDSNELDQAIQDYFAGDISREEAVDLLLMYTAKMPVEYDVPTSSPAATGTPTATPLPTFTPTPTPVPPDPEAMLSCPVERQSGSAGTGLSQVLAVEQANSHFEVVLTNPASDRWRYGLSITPQDYWTGSTTRPLTYEIRVDHQGVWTMVLVNSGTIQEVGYLATHNVPFDTSPGGKNLLTFFTWTGPPWEERERGGRVRPSPIPSRFYVNGVQVPIDGWVEWRTGVPYARDYRTDREYGFFSWPQTEYDGLCSVLSWTHPLPE